jgi:hypothetical protein
MADDPTPSRDDAAITSVAAHGMLNSLGVAKATIATLRLHFDSIDRETCLALLARADAQLGFLAESLGDLIRGIPSEARQLLDALPEHRDADQH